MNLTLGQQPLPWQRTLAECEAVIERGLPAFVAVSEAFLEVHDRHLYRDAGYGSFDAYWRDRWPALREQRRELVGQLRGEGWSLPTIAAATGTSVTTAWRDAQVFHVENLPERSTGLDGKTYPARRVTPPAAAHAARTERIAASVLEREARFLAGGDPGAVPAEWYGRVLPMDALTYLRALPDACVDLCVTSPPYWAKRAYSAGDPDELGQEPDPGTYVEALRRIVGQIGRVLTETGWLFLVLGDTYASQPGQQRGDPDRLRGISASSRRYSGSAPAGRRFDVPDKSLCLVPWRLLTALVQGEGWRCRNVICWHKPNHLPENLNDRLTQAWEPVFALTRSEYPYFQRGAGEGDLWAIAVGHEPNPNGHPAVFPSRLVHRIIGHACPPGGVVLDPFAGSGTVLRVAHSEGRRFLGCDLVEWQGEDAAE